MNADLSDRYKRLYKSIDSIPDYPKMDFILWWSTPPYVRLSFLALQEYVEELEAKVNELKARLKLNSSNSSLPPSTDNLRTRKERKKSKSTGRKKGGQPGHDGYYRKLLPVEEVDKVIDYFPEKCSYCGKILSIVPANRSYVRHQVQEIEFVKAHTSEYRFHEFKCPCCKEKTRAQWPTEVPRRTFGPNLQAAVSLLSGKYRLSKREIKELLSDTMGVDISTGSIINLEQEISKVIKEPVEKARDYVKNSEVVNTDETGWRNENELSWLWTGVSDAVTVFMISKHRDKKSLEELLGKDYGGIIGSDRYSAYNLYHPEKRALCWAHLKRDFKRLEELGGNCKKIGKRLLRIEKKVFDLWNKFKTGKFSRDTLKSHMNPVLNCAARLLEDGTKLKDKKVARFCKSLLKLWSGLWKFLYVEGVEPTNNSAERALRPAVLARKGSFGNQSERGTKFTERIYTVVATCKKQKRNVLDFLVECSKAELSGKAMPSLIPVFQDSS